MNIHDTGDVVRVNVAFTNLAGAPVDPGVVTVRIKNPVGVKTSYVYGIAVEVVKDSVGLYHMDLEPTIQGVWVYRWEGTVSNKGAEESSFEVKESEFD